MNSNQNKSIILICQSDVILTGLNTILKSTQASEIIPLHRGDEVIDFPELNGNILIIATPEEMDKSGGMIRQVLNTAVKIQFMNLNYDTNPTPSNQTLNIYDSPSLICYKVNEILAAFNLHQAKENDTELTKREIDVLQLVTKGYSNKEIADQLFVSTHTVISHRKNISEKTGIKSASGLTMYAILKKIIDVSEIDAADLI